MATSPTSHPNEDKKVSLRPYQENAIHSVLAYLATGGKRAGLSLATGSGKTVIFSHLISRVPPPTQDATQTLILAHRQELVEQAARHCRALYPDQTVEIEMAARHATGLAHITVASVQSLTRGDRLSRYDPQRFKMLLVDEAHHSAAAGYLDILNHFGLLNAPHVGPACLVGVSATFSRQDGVKLGKAFDDIVYHQDYMDMIQDEWLSPLILTTVQSGVKLDNVKQSADDFHIGALSKAVNTDKTNAVTVGAWMAKARGRKSTLVFCADLSHVASLTAMFRAYGVDARFVTSDTSKKVRNERLEAFKNGEYPVLVNCGIYTEGTDIPNIDCVLLARPTQSRNLLVQMIGRGLRKHPGKVNCHVIDMVASLETGIVTSPTLYGLDPDELVQEADGRELQRLKDKRQREHEQEREAQAQAVGTLSPSGQVVPPNLSGEITFTDYDSVNDLIDDAAGERHIRQISRYAWVQIDEAKYILSTQSGSFLRIQRDEEQPEQFIVTYTKRVQQTSGAKNNTVLARPKTVATAITFADAVHAADTFAGKTFPTVLVCTSAAWRRATATNAQIDFLNKSRGADAKLAYGSLTKGRAGDMITKLRHGARGAFKRYAVKSRAAQRKAKKTELWREKLERSRVQVGRVT